MSTQHPHWSLLKLLHSQPQLNQRQLAEQTGMSLGKVNYCMRALIAKGQIKLENFSNADNKRQYVYLLTPAGIEEKTRVTLLFIEKSKRNMM